MYSQFYLLREDVTQVGDLGKDTWAVWDSGGGVSRCTSAALFAMRCRVAMVSWSCDGSGIIIEELLAGLLPDTLVVSRFGATTVGCVRVTAGMFREANRAGQ